jgi:hypothetical protein
MPERLRVAAFVIVLVGLAATPAGAQVAAGLDQYQVDSTVTGLIHSTNSTGQWFTVGFDGVLWAVEISLDSVVSTTEILVVEVYDVSGGLPGTLLGSTTVAPGETSPELVQLDPNTVTCTLVPLHNLGRAVVAGDQIGIQLSTGQASPFGYQVRFNGSPDLYPGGQMYSGANPNTDSDLAFKVFIAVPIFGDSFENGDTLAWSHTSP